MNSTLPLLRVHTLGRLELTLNDVPLPPRTSRKAEALLVYLACTGIVQPREHLADLLYEERSQDQSLADLRVTLNRLGKDLAPYLTITRRTIALRPGTYWLDVSELESAFRNLKAIHSQPSDFARLAPSLEAALMLYKGDFLAGFHIREAINFEQWVLTEQSRFQVHLAGLLDYLSDGFLTQGQHRAGISYAARLVQLDALSEDAQRRLMRLLAYSGQRGAALAQYESCRRVLTSELNISPEPETTMLYHQIRRGELGLMQDRDSASPSRNAKAGLRVSHF